MLRNKNKRTHERYRLGTYEKMDNEYEYMEFGHPVP